MAGKSTYADLVKKNVAPELSEDQTIEETISTTTKAASAPKANGKPPKAVKKQEDFSKLTGTQNGHASSSLSASSKSVSPAPAPEVVAIKAKVVEEPEAVEEVDLTGFIVVKGRERKHSTSSRQSGYRNASGRPGSSRRGNFKKGGGDTVSESGKKKSFDEKRDDEKLKYLNRFGKKEGALGFEVKNGDVFSAPSTASLAHCVSEDFEAKDGVTKQFKERFGAVDKLVGQNIKTGGCAFLESEGRFLFYLVTRNFSFHRPYYSSLEKSLKELRKHCTALGVTELAMPLIGNRQDQLEWDIVSRLIEHIFSGTGIQLTVYKYKSERRPPHTPRQRKRVEE